MGQIKRGVMGSDLFGKGILLSFILNGKTFACRRVFNTPANGDFVRLKKGLYKVTGVLWIYSERDDRSVTVDCEIEFIKSIK